MRLAEFDYDLPEDLIAQRPLDQRDASRMLVLDRRNKRWTDAWFLDFPSWLGDGDVVVVNNTRVFPARLPARREPRGGNAELLLLVEHEPRLWETLARPARRLRAGTRLTFADSRLEAEVVEELEGGRRMVRFHCDGSFHGILEAVGQTPLPPYIKRPDAALDEDRERYQTVYARDHGAIAAPTAGLHFTPRVLREVENRGAQLVEITLHVGYGTFEPVRVTDVNEHRVAPERYVIGDAAAEIINQVLAARPNGERGRRVIAIGTTTVRALESAVDESGRVRSGAGEARLTIAPGYTFRATDALLTNFHLPRSSLLFLVAAFAGRDLALQAYRHAVDAKYRFYSYGDCMLII